MKKIAGKNIVLTGCNSGIGYEFLQLISEENNVLCVDVNVDKLNLLAAENPSLTVMR